MKKLFPLAGLLLLAFTANIEPPQMVTIQGTFIDTKCYGMNEMNAGNDHMVPGKDGQMMKVPNCATACAQTGIPTGVLQEDGKVVILVTPTTQLAEHMAKEARITGQRVFDGGILPEKIEVKEGRRWKEVHITTMM